jgi:hypothetical protein
VPAEPFPERAAVVRVELPAQLGDHLRREALGEFGDEQQAALREERADPRSPVALVDEQRAQLGVARVIIGEEQRRSGRVDVERARGVDQRADMVVVPRFLEPDGGLDRGDTDDAIGIAVANDASERAIRSDNRSRFAGSVVRPVPVRSDSASTAGRSSWAIGRTWNTRGP